MDWILKLGISPRNKYYSMAVLRSEDDLFYSNKKYSEYLRNQVFNGLIESANEVKNKIFFLPKNEQVICSQKIEKAIFWAKRIQGDLFRARKDAQERFLFEVLPNIKYVNDKINTYVNKYKSKIPNVNFVYAQADVMLEISKARFNELNQKFVINDDEKKELEILKRNRSNLSRGKGIFTNSDKMLGAIIIKLALAEIQVLMDALNKEREEAERQAQEKAKAERLEAERLAREEEDRKRKIEAEAKRAEFEAKKLELELQKEAALMETARLQAEEDKKKAEAELAQVEEMQALKKELIIAQIESAQAKAEAQKLLVEQQSKNAVKVMQAKAQAQQTLLDVQSQTTSAVLKSQANVEIAKAKKQEELIGQTKVGEIILPENAVVEELIGASENEMLSTGMDATPILEMAENAKVISEAVVANEDNAKLLAETEKLDQTIEQATMATIPIGTPVTPVPLANARTENPAPNERALPVEILAVEPDEVASEDVAQLAVENPEKVDALNPETVGNPEVFEDVVFSEAEPFDPEADMEAMEDIVEAVSTLDTLTEEEMASLSDEELMALVEEDEMLKMASSAPAKKDNMPLIIAVSTSVFLLLGIGGWYLHSRNNQ